MGNIYQKKILGLGLAGVSLASILGSRQVSADSLDDAVAFARNKGLQVIHKGTTEVEVATYDELNQKTKLEEKRVADLASNIAKEADLYKNDADKIVSQNQEVLNKYQQESEAVAKENKETLAQYEAELARVKASNAEKERVNDEARNKVLEANQKAQNDFDKATVAIASERQKIAADYQVQVDRVNAENRARIAAVESENQALYADYQEKLGNYNRELLNIIKANAKKKMQYESDLSRAMSENSRIDAANKKAQADYEVEKAATEKANSEAKAKYEADKAEYGEAKSRWEEDKRLLDTEGHLVLDERAQYLKIDEAGLKKGETKVVRIDIRDTENGSRNAALEKVRADYSAELKRVYKEIEDAKAKITAGGSTSSGISKEEYDQERQKWLNDANIFKIQLKSSQESDLKNPRQFYTQFRKFMAGVIGREDESRENLNRHTMKFEKSSSKVRYLTTQNYPDIQTAMSQGVDPQNPAYEESATPVQGTMAKINYYAVAIPKGESVTVEYSLADGQPYLNKPVDIKDPSGDNPHFPFFSFVNLTDSNTDKKFEINEVKGLDKIKVTYKNNGSLNGDGDVIVFFANDTGIPIYTGISDMTSLAGERIFPGDSVSTRLLGNDHTLEFLDKDNNRLAPAMLVFETHDNPEQHNYKIIKGAHYRTQKDLNTTFDTSTPSELVTQAGDGDISEHGVDFKNSYKSVDTIPDLPANWKDTMAWINIQSGFDKDGLYRARHNSFDKDLSEKGRHIQPTKYNVGYLKTEYYMAGQADDFYFARPASLKPFTLKEPATATVSPVKYMIDYKIDFTTPEPMDPQAPSYKEVPVAPTAKPKVDLPAEPTYDPNPEKPNRPQYKTPTLEAEPEKPEYPQFPQAPTPQVVPDKVVPETELVKPDLKPNPDKPNLIPEPKQPSFEVNRIKYVLKPRSSHGNTFVIKKMGDAKRVASGNSLVVRMKHKLGLK